MSSVRIYKKNECVVFRKTSGEFGALSNMAPGFPIYWQHILIHTSEALYQALRYPDLPEIQMEIISQTSPMTAKMKSKKYYSKTRPDWPIIRYKIMRLCLELKLVQNWDKFYPILKSTGKKFIVEFAPEGKVWGASDKGTNYEGTNALGRLLMELRENYIFRTPPNKIYIPEVINIKILGIDVSKIIINMPS